MTVKLLQHILYGLPEQCEVKFVQNGVLCDITIMGITRTEDLPSPWLHSTISESIVVTDADNLEELEKTIKVKKVWRKLDGKEAV